jgi:hypothetical protein
MIILTYSCNELSPGKTQNQIEVEVRGNTSSTEMQRFWNELLNGDVARDAKPRLVIRCQEHHISPERVFEGPKH